MYATHHNYVSSSLCRLLCKCKAVSNEVGNILYFTDWDDEDDCGTLMLYNGKESVKISDEVSNYYSLSDGKVIGAGKHEELLENCGEYRIIAQAQMGDGKEAV